MSVNIKLKRSSVPGNIPTISQLELGEIALNTYDGKAYFKKQVGVSQSIVEIASTGSTVASASYAAYASAAGTASFAYTATSSSYSLIATSASYSATATSASYALNTTSASYAASSSYASNFNVSGNLVVGGNITATTLHVQTITSSIVFSSGSNIFGDATNDTQTLIGTVNISGSFNITGSATINNLTGSLYGTASWALSASVAPNYTLTSSFQNFTQSYYSASASFDTRTTNNSSSISYLSSSYLVSSASFDTRSTNNSSSISYLSSSYLASSSSFDTRLFNNSSSTSYLSSSFLTNSASFDYRINLISGSFVTTASFNVFTASYYNDSASFNTRTLNNSSSISLLSSSFLAVSGAYSTRLVALELFSSSLDATFATDADLNALSSSYIAFTSSMNAFRASILNYTSSTNASIAALNAQTASLLAQTASLNAFTSSINSFTQSYYTTSGSVSTRLVALELFSSSLDSTYATDAQLNYSSSILSASIAVLSGSYLNSSASFDTRITNTSASVASLSSSFLNFSSSFRTGSFSGSFTGIFTGSLDNLRGTPTHIPYFSSSQVLADSAMYQISGSSIAINQTGITTANPEALYVYQPSTSSFNVITGKGNLNNYLQLNIQNTNAGATASSDVVATANNGNESSFYIDMGINGQNYVDQITNGPGNANDAYLYSVANDMYVGNYVDGKSLFLFNGVNGDNNPILTLAANKNVYISSSLYVTGSVNVGGGTLYLDPSSNRFTIAGAGLDLYSSTGTVQVVNNSFNVPNGGITTNYVTASLYGTASWAVSSSNATTASYALNATSASYANNTTSASYTATASYANNFTVAGTLTAQTIIAQVITSSTDFVTGSTHFGSIISNTHQFTGSVSVSGSLAVNNSNVILTNQTSSMSVLSASYASGSTSASYANNATTASYALNATTASYSSVATSASYASASTSASYAQQATSASFATTAASGTGSFTGSFSGTHTGSLLGTASRADNTTSASYAATATSASYSLVATSASYASTSTSASFAQQSTTASYALDAISASYASTSTSASFASNAAQAQTASYVVTAQTASFVITAQTASFVATASYANNANLLDGLDSTVFATTGSNTFRGNQTVTGSLFTSGSNTLIGSTSLTGSFVISGSETVTGYIQFLPVVTNVDNTVSASYIYVSGSTSDLYFSQNGNGYSNTSRLRWLESNLYTGLLSGGVISASLGSTSFSVTSGSAIIVSMGASTASVDPYPTVKRVSWNNISASLINSGSAKITYVGIDGNGAIVQQTVPWGSTDVNQYDTQIELGVVLHLSGSIVTGIYNSPQVSYGFAQQTDDFLRAFGPIKISGHSMTPSGSSPTLSLIKTGGTAYNRGANYVNNANHPSTVTDPAFNISKIYRYYISGSTPVIDSGVGGAGYTTIDNTKYVDTTTGLLATVGNSNWSIQRVFWIPNSPTNAFLVYYGNARYGTLLNAVNAKDSEQFTEAPNTAANAIFLGYIIIQGGANRDLLDPTDTTIIPGGLFRSVGGVASSGTAPTSTTLAGLADVSIPTRTTGDLLYYNGSQWVNTKQLSGSFGFTGSLGVLGTISASSFTGSLFGTSSWANNATTASYALVATSASYASASTTASFASNAAQASTASYVVLAQTASFITTAQTASFVTTAQTASYVATASYANNADLLDGLNSTIFATTGSNIFVGNQTISGSIFQTGSSVLLGGNVGVGLSSLYDSTQYSLEINGGLLVKNLSKTASLTLINADPSVGGNNAFVVHSVGGTSGTSYARIQGYYGASVTGYTVLQLNPFGGNVGINTLTASLATLQVGGNVYATSFTGSFSGTASYATDALTASYVANASSFPYTGSAIITGSLTLIGNEIITGSLTATSLTGSLFGTASYATSASQALTASYVVTAQTASYVNPLTQSILLSGSLTTTGTITAQTLVVQTVSSSVIYSSGSNVFGNSLANTQVFTGSFSQTGSTAYFAGNVGIGTTSPSAKLVVNGNGARIRMETASDPTGYYSYWETNYDAANTFNIVDGGINKFGSKALLSYNDTYVNSYYNIYFATGTTTNSSASNIRMFITSDGNIGIGTTNPQGILSILGNTTTSQAIHLYNTSSTNGDYSEIRKRYSPTDGSFSAGIRFIKESTGINYGSSIGFLTELDAGSQFYDYAMYIKNRNVGIGTTSPTARLHVYDAGNTFSGIFGSGGGAQIVALGNGSGIAQVQGFTSNAFAAYSNIGLNSGGGNVLIGTTTDAGYKLDVNGTGRFSSVGTATVRLKGNSTTGLDLQNDLGGGYIWNRDATSLYFATNNTQRLEIASTGEATFSSSVTATSFTGSLFGTASYATNALTSSYALVATSASYAATASYASTLNIGISQISTNTVASSIVGANNLFTTSTGSFTSGFYKYNAYSGSNSRAGEVVASWINGVAVYTDFSTVDIGTTTVVTASVSIVTAQAQFNVQTNTSGWTIKSQVTYI
jgi:hypothetical protein